MRRGHARGRGYRPVLWGASQRLPNTERFPAPRTRYTPDRGVSTGWCSASDKIWAQVRTLLIIALILVAVFVLFGAGALDQVAHVAVQILGAVFHLLVRLIDGFVGLLKSVG